MTLTAGPCWPAVRPVPSGQCIAQGDAAQTVRAGYPFYGAGAIGIGIAICTVHRVAIERVTDDGRMVRTIGIIVQTTRIDMGVVLAIRRGMAEAAIESATLEVDGRAVPDVHIVVRIGILRIEHAHPIAPHAYMAAAYTYRGTGIDLRCKRDLVHEVLVDRHLRTGQARPGADIVTGNTIGTDIDISSGVLHLLNIGWYIIVAGSTCSIELPGSNGRTKLGKGR